MPRDSTLGGMGNWIAFSPNQPLRIANTGKLNQIGWKMEAGHNWIGRGPVLPLSPKIGRILSPLSLPHRKWLTDFSGWPPLANEIRNRLFTEFQNIVALTGDEKLMLDEHRDKLFAAHQGDYRGKHNRRIHGP